jgi:hypothetical protein
MHFGHLWSSASENDHNLIQDLSDYNHCHASRDGYEKQCKKHVKSSNDYVKCKRQVDYINIKGSLNFAGTGPPNSEASLAILNNTRRTISPRYMPPIIFS